MQIIPEQAKMIENLKENGIDAEYQNIKSLQHYLINFGGKYIKIMTSYGPTLCVASLVNEKNNERLVVACGKMKVGNNLKDVEDFNKMEDKLVIIGDKGTNVGINLEEKRIIKRIHSAYLDIKENNLLIALTQNEMLPVYNDRTDYVVCDLDSKEVLVFQDSDNKYRTKANKKLEDITRVDIENFIKAENKRINEMVMS